MGDNKDEVERVRDQYTAKRGAYMTEMLFKHALVYISMFWQDKLF